MKKFKFSPRINLQLAVCGLLLILGLLTYYAFSSVSNVATTQYIYIDEDDTQDSVIAKIQPFANLIGMTTLNTLIRHSGYSENIRTGRYAIEPGDGPITIFRKLKSGRQTSLNLTIPESRTMDRLAAILSNKLMLDSATIAEALTSQEVCEKLGYDTCTIAAMFVPNTYNVYWNMSIDELLQCYVCTQHLRCVLEHEH